MKKKYMKSGFTLIELMVVIVLVMILALAVVPAFKKIVIKARYTEGVSAVSALRTQIKVFHTENSRLPGVDSDIVRSDTAEAGGASWTDPADIAAAVAGVKNALTEEPTAMGPIVQTLCSKIDEQWAIIDSNVYSLDTVNNDNESESSIWQSDLQISMGEYGGKSFENRNYQYAAFNAGMDEDGSYGYAILCAGEGKVPVGTGCGVLEIVNTSWGEDRSLTLICNRYEVATATAGPADKTAGDPLFLMVGVPVDGVNPNYLAIPAWSDIDDPAMFTEEFTPAGGNMRLRPDLDAFADIGWVE